MPTAPTTEAPSTPRGMPFQVRGSLQTVLSLRLLAPAHPDFFALLLDKIAHSPDFFREAPVVLDVGPVAGEAVPELPEFLERLRQTRLLPVGIQNGSPAWNEAAAAAGLALFGAGAAASAPARAQPGAAKAEAVLPPRGPARIIAEPVRGGQQLMTNDGDLIVTAMVGNGAEIGAAGHIHVYGRLRGRAFAGIGGDETAMIFCDQLEAELLSIAGVHLVNEEIDPRHLGRRVRVRLEHERIAIQAVG